jgi:hypothetical protein
MEARYWILELSRNIHLYVKSIVFYVWLIADVGECRGTPGAQRVFSSKPIVHQCCVEPQGECGPCLPAARCELLPINNCALLAGEELYQSHGWEQATYPCMVVSGGG